MQPDPITEEIRSIRRKLAAEFDNDISLILADVRQREAADGRVYISLPKHLVRAEAAGQSAGQTAADSAV